MKLASPPAEAYPALNDIVYVNVSQSGTINAGAYEEVDIEAPVGYAYEVLQARIVIDPPAGATSGTHQVELTNAPFYGMFLGKSVFGTGILWDHNIWKLADSEQRPDNVEGQVNALKALRAIGGKRKITLRYENNTDANNSFGRFYNFWCLKIKV